MEVKSDIDPIEIGHTCMTIQLANKETICHAGIVREVEVLVGKVEYPVDFVVLACPQDSFCPIIFGRPFLHTIFAEINLPKKLLYVVQVKCWNLIFPSLLINHMQRRILQMMR
jgi:hypothetical protein